MVPRSIAKHFDAVEEIGLGQLAGLVDAFANSFFLRTAKERFGDRTIPTVAAPTHAWLEMVFVAEAQPVITAVLRALIRVNQPMPRLASPHRHQLRVDHEFAGQGRLH